MAGVADAGEAELRIRPALEAGFNRKLTSQVQAPLGRAGEQASHHFGRRFAAGLKTAGKVAGVGLAAGLVVAARGVFKATEGYREHQRVVRQTAAAIKSTGGAAKVSTRDVTRLADALERKTTIDGDVIQRGANMLLTFTNIRREVGKGNDIFGQATRTVLDMSVALGQDTKNSAIQLGKALNDPVKGVTALQRVGVTFTAQQRDQIKTLVEHGHRLQAQKLILAELNKEFGGSAAAAATPLGRLQVLFRQVGDAVGSVFAPALDTVTSGLLRKFGPVVTDFTARQGPKAAKWLNTMAKRFVEAVPPADQISDRLARLGAKAGELVDRIAEVGPGFLAWTRQMGPQLHLVGEAMFTASAGGGVFADTLAIVGPILDVVGRNMHNLVPWLPVILTGFLAFRTVKSALGPVRELGQAIANFTSPLTAVATLANARATRQLAAAKREETAATLAALGAQRAELVTQRAEIATAGKGRIATLAGAAAQKIAAVASGLLSLGLRAVGVAWAFATGPIGIAIAVIALLAAGIVLLWKHSETFRNVVRRVWDAVRDKIATVVTFIIGLFRAQLNMAINVVLGILHIWGKLPGPMGAPFRKAEESVRQAKQTINTQLDKVQARVNQLRGKDIPVNLKSTFTPPHGFSMHSIVGAHKGIRLPGYGGGDRIPAMLEAGETVVPKEASRDPGFIAWAKQQRIPGFAKGGAVGWFPSGYMTAVQGALDRVGAAAGRGIERGFRLLITGSPAIQAFIRSTDRLPYVWGAAGPGAYDCSGLVSAVLGKMLGLPGAGHGLRLFTTSSIRSGMYGLRSGLGGMLQIGVTAGTGHMAGRYGPPGAGLGFEAESTRSGIKIGRAASPPEAFARHFYHMARGGRVTAAMARRVAALAALGVDVGGDAGALRLNGQVLDHGGWLQPGLSLTWNGTGRPERVPPPDGGPMLDARSARMIGRAVADALQAAGIGATYLDSRRAEQLLAGAGLANSRRR